MAEGVRPLRYFRRDDLYNLARLRASDFVGSALRTIFLRVRQMVRDADPTRIAHGYLVTSPHKPRTICLHPVGMPANRTL